MTNNDLMLQIGTLLNTTEAEKRLNGFLKKREITTEINLNGTKAFQTLTTYVNKMKQTLSTLKFTDEFGNTIEEVTKVANGYGIASKETQQWTDSNGRLVTQIREVNSENQTLVTTTSQYIDAQGRAVKEIQQYDNAMNPLGNTIREVNNITKDLTNTTTQSKQTIIDQGKSYEALVTTTEKVVSNGEYLKTVVSQYTDEMGRSVVKTEQFDRAGNQVATTTRNIKQSFDDTSKSAKTLGQSFSDIVGKVTKFYLASLPIRVVQTMVTDGTQAVKEFDSAFTELAKVSTLNGNALKEYSNQLADVGDRVARTKTEMVQTATELTKAGYNPQDTKTLSELVALYQNTADEELSASEATSVLVSQLKAFNKEASEGIHITDAINKVSAEFAVSSGDIGRGLTQAGASLSTYGNSFDQTIGLITSGTEIFQGRQTCP